MGSLKKQQGRDAQIFHEVLKTIPAARSDQREVTRKATLVNRVELTVHLMCVVSQSELPFGTDRRLLAWLWGRALRTGELDVSWDTLLKYLGPGSTAAQQQMLAYAADRIGSVLASYRTSDGLSNNLAFVSRQCFDRRGVYLAEDGAETFEGGTWFELSGELMELARRAEIQNEDKPPTPILRHSYHRQSGVIHG